MSGLCLPSSCTTSSTCPNFFSLLMSNFFYLCSFILSHPLYFSYLVLFSPYLLKLLSFLSPLFITTTLLLLTLFTISPSLILHNNSASTEFSESRNENALLSTCNAVVERLTPNDDEIDEPEELEAYKIVFGTSIIGVQENSAEFLDYTSAEESETPLLDSPCHDKDQPLTDNLHENSAGVESTKHAVEEKTLENFFKELDEFENKTWSHDVIEKQEEVVLVRNGSKEAVSSNIVNVHYQGLNQNLGNVGTSCRSMKKEKEWKRTLACKLFEERHNGSYSSSEGMDMLWETYEMETKKNKVKRQSNSFKMKKKGELKGYEKEYDKDEEEMDQQQLCCLQALKFSSRKMNFGMGRPNLVKISKAFRGFGWLHHVSKNNKKVHCGDSF